MPKLLIINNLFCLCSRLRPPTNSRLKRRPAPSDKAQCPGIAERFARDSAKVVVRLHQAGRVHARDTEGHQGADWRVANWFVPDPGSILWLANRYLPVDRKLDLQGCAGSAEANEELLGWPAESVLHMGYTVRIDLGDDRWVWIHVPEVHGIDQGGSRRNHLFVHCAIEGYRYLQVRIRVASIAAGFQARDHVVSGDHLFFQDWVVAVHAVEKIIGTRRPV